MSSVLKYINQNPQEAQRLVGLKYESVKNLIAKTEELHEKKQVSLDSQKRRIIKKGGGRKPKLSVPEQILLTLVYLRHLPTFQLLGIQFGISETTANDIFNYWFPLLRELLPASPIEQVKKNAEDYEMVKEMLTGFERIAQARFRLNTKKYEQIVLTICGLVRLRIKSLILSGQKSTKLS
ncbi:MAG: transposase family protein [Hydrococcus sp. CSU_1_8]|nr:transposase family protein [Hydrococcus sp. CSU_1_8]